jgi:hypothetical protein
MSANLMGHRQVGEFSTPRQLIRSVKNPVDKSTVVSIYPREIKEYKPTIEPGRFHIAPGDLKNPAILVVGSSSWWKDIDIDQPMLEIPVNSVQIAHSIINDYCNGLVGCNMNDAMPGMFFIPGEKSLEEIKTKYSLELSKAALKQTNWYKILVKLADALWSRTNGNPLSVSEEMKLAARSLNLNEKPWLRDFQIIEKVPCVACGSLKDPAFPVCPVCKAIDSNHPMAKELKFAI